MKRQNRLMLAQTKEGKPIIPTESNWHEWDKRVQPILKAMYVETRKELIRVFTETQFGTMDSSVSAQAQIVINKLMAKYDKIFGDLSKSVVDKMIDKVMRNSTASLKMSLSDYVNPLAIDRTATNERLKEIIQASTKEAASLIKRIPERYLSEVQGEVMRSITSGNGMKDLVPYLTKRYEGDARWARHVAMDQTRKAHSSISNARMRQLGIEKFKWLHTRGSAHPRKHHIELSGQIFRYDDPPIIDPKTGQTGLPSYLPFCHPYDSKVETTNGLLKLYRRRYSGVLASIVTDMGIVIEATINHPILTSVGWKAIKDINVGDYIIETSNQSINRFKNEIQNSAATIGDLFDSAASNIGMTSRNGCDSMLQFHGDMSDGKIDIIDIDGFLLQKADAMFCQKIVKFLLAITENGFRFSDEQGFGSADETIMRAFGAPDSIVSSLCSILSLFRSHFSHANDISHALSSNFASMLSNDSSDDSARHIETFRQLKLANPCTIEARNFALRELYAIIGRAFDLGDFEAPHAQLLGQIIGMTSESCGDLAKPESFIKKLNRVTEIRFSEFAGHVYNLETSRNWFTTEGIITHNCRCVAVPIIFSDEEN